MADMFIKSRLKGGLGQSVVKAAFSHWRYRVIPFGIEETLREINTLDKDKYKKLNMHPRMRFMPDFIIASSDMESVRLVEVKFRSRWSEYTHGRTLGELKRQANHWGELLVIFVFADFFKQGPCIKCLLIKESCSGENLRVVTQNGEVDFSDVGENEFRELSDFFAEVRTDMPEFREALRDIVSVQSRLTDSSSAAKVVKSDLPKTLKNSLPPRKPGSSGTSPNTPRV